jgi:hypothetical protein
MSLTMCAGPFVLTGLFLLAGDGQAAPPDSAAAVDLRPLSAPSAATAWRPDSSVPVPVPLVGNQVLLSNTSAALLPPVGLTAPTALQERAFADLTLEQRLDAFCIPLIRASQVNAPKPGAAPTPTPVAQVSYTWLAQTSLARTRAAPTAEQQLDALLARKTKK